MQYQSQGALYENLIVTGNSFVFADICAIGKFELLRGKYDIISRARHALVIVTATIIRRRVSASFIKLDYLIRTSFYYFLTIFLFTIQV